MVQSERIRNLISELKRQKDIYQEVLSGNFDIPFKHTDEFIRGQIFEIARLLNVLGAGENEY